MIGDLLKVNSQPLLMAVPSFHLFLVPSFFYMMLNNIFVDRKLETQENEVVFHDQLISESLAD